MRLYLQGEIVRWLPIASAALPLPVTSGFLIWEEIQTDWLNSRVLKTCFISHFLFRWRGNFFHVSLLLFKAHEFEAAIRTLLVSPNLPFNTNNRLPDNPFRRTSKSFYALHLCTKPLLISLEGSETRQSTQ